MKLWENLSQPDGELQSKVCPLQEPHTGQKQPGRGILIALGHWLGLSRQ